MNERTWKTAFYREVRRLLWIPPAMAWECAGAHFESNGGDLDEDPVECARYEYECWCADADPSLLA